MIHRWPPNDAADGNGYGPRWLRPHRPGTPGPRPATRLGHPLQGAGRHEQVGHGRTVVAGGGGVHSAGGSGCCCRWVQFRHAACRAAARQGHTGLPPGLAVDCLVRAPRCYAPLPFRVAYGVQPLVDRGLDGGGQTVVFVEAPARRLLTTSARISPGTTADSGAGQAISPWCAGQDPPAPAWPDKAHRGLDQPKQSPDVTDCRRKPVHVGSRNGSFAGRPADRRPDSKDCE
jgi:hypothetical protein